MPVHVHIIIFQLVIKPAGIARKVKLPLDIVIGTVPINQSQAQRASYHPLPSTVSDSSCPFPFFENNSLKLGLMRVLTRFLNKILLPILDPVY